MNYKIFDDFKFGLILEAQPPIKIAENYETTVQDEFLQMI
jgi:hypothetical protein